MKATIVRWKTCDKKVRWTMSFCWWQHQSLLVVWYHVAIIPMEHELAPRPMDSYWQINQRPFPHPEQRSSLVDNCTLVKSFLTNIFQFLPPANEVAGRYCIHRRLGVCPSFCPSTVCVCVCVCGVGGRYITHIME